LTDGLLGEMVMPSLEESMRHEKVPDNPTCLLCELEVLPGENVIFSHGDIVHIKCRVTTEGITDSVAHLLRRNAGTEYCQSCVARLLHSTYEQAMKAVTALRMSSRYRIRAMGTCSVCGNHWLTIKAEPPSIDGT
jgi:hypothetical protein